MLRRAAPLALLCALAAAPALAAPGGSAPAESPATTPADALADTAPTSSIADYYAALERAGLVDTKPGTLAQLRTDVAAGEKLLADGSNVDAAVTFYAVVEGPRYKALADTVEFQSAEYYLAVALATAGAYDSALDYLLRVMQRGPGKLYFTPAHRRAIDIALETRDYDSVLRRLGRLEVTGAVPAGALGEEAYLRARAAYQRASDTGDEQEYDQAEHDLTSVSRKSRLYSSALYLRGVIRARRGEFRRAAEAMCEIVDTPDNNKFTFVVDDRYFTIKDLARLGLGRIAHETGEYDDAYYHYFQIPDDSDRLPEALFEAAWSMYQKRELATARDLVVEFLHQFPDSSLMFEGRLLAGYIELADCKFDASQRIYDRLVRDLKPVVAEIDRLRKDSDLRRQLFETAVARRRTAPEPGHKAPRSSRDQVLALLQVDPEFLRIQDALAGLRSAAGTAPHVVRAWRELAQASTKMAVVGTAARPADSDASALLEEVDRLHDSVDIQRAQLHRARRNNTIPPDEAITEEARLDQLDQDISALAARVEAVAARTDSDLAAASPTDLAPMVGADLARARQLRRSTDELLVRLTDAADQLAAASLDRLYRDTRRVYDKARLGKIDSVIGQKRQLDIQVQDLAAGRYPPELHGRLWEQGLIGDDEEYWPFQGEYWSDEYEGWR